MTTTAAMSARRSWREVAEKTLRLLHLLGLTMFLGTILSSTLLSLGAPATGDAETIVFTWNAINHVNTFLTTPGMLLTALTGIALMVVERRSPLTDVWLAAKLVLTVAIIANATLVITPTETQLLAAAAASPAGDARAPVARLASRQATFGAINVAMIAVASMLGVVKPQLRRGNFEGTSLFSDR